MTPTHTGVVDLRQYTLVPGRRDALIELFDRHFVDGQEAAGIHVIGQFSDLDDPDRFVWLREFESMAAPGEALPRFTKLCSMPAPLDLHVAQTVGNWLLPAVLACTVAGHPALSLLPRHCCG